MFVSGEVGRHVVPKWREAVNIDIQERVIQQRQVLAQRRGQVSFSRSVSNLIVALFLPSDKIARDYASTRENIANKPRLLWLLVH